MLMLMFSACPADRRRRAVDASLGPDLRALAPEHPCRRLPGTLGLSPIFYSFFEISFFTRTPWPDPKHFVKLFGLLPFLTVENHETLP